MGLWQECGALVDVGQQVHLEVGGEGVRQAHVAREGGQDEVAHLDAAGRDDLAQLEVVLAQELREVMQQHQQHPQGPLHQTACQTTVSLTLFGSKAFIYNWPVCCCEAQP